VRVAHIERLNPRIVETIVQTRAPLPIAAGRFCAAHIVVFECEVRASLVLEKKRIRGEAFVRAYAAYPKLRMANHPLCKLCVTPMWLISIEPDRPKHDRRTFECPRCQEVMVQVVDYGSETEHPRSSRHRKNFAGN